MIDFTRRRLKMIEDLRQRGIPEDVLAAFAEVPREAFVPEALRDHAYDDGPLPIGAGQTISQPFIVALMIAAARISADARVLEIGAGSGYAAAVISRIAARVFAVERHEVLAEDARARLTALGYDNAEMQAGDGSLGFPEAAPFDAIIVSAGAPAVPEPLKKQLALGGRLVIPVGHTAREQRLVALERIDADQFGQRDLGAVAFVPLVGKAGWSDES